MSSDSNSNYKSRLNKNLNKQNVHKSKSYKFPVKDNKPSSLFQESDEKNQDIYQAKKQLTIKLKSNNNIVKSQTIDKNRLMTPTQFQRQETQRKKQKYTEQQDSHKLSDPMSDIESVFRCSARQKTDQIKNKINTLYGTHNGDVVKQKQLVNKFTSKARINSRQRQIQEQIRQYNETLKAKSQESQSSLTYSERSVTSENLTPIAKRRGDYTGGNIQSIEMYKEANFKNPEIITKLIKSGQSAPLDDEKKKNQATMDQLMPPKKLLKKQDTGYFGSVGFDLNIFKQNLSKDNAVSQGDQTNPKPPSRIGTGCFQSQSVSARFGKATSSRSKSSSAKERDLANQKGPSINQLANMTLKDNLNKYSNQKMTMENKQVKAEKDKQLNYQIAQKKFLQSEQEQNSRRIIDDQINAITKRSFRDEGLKQMLMIDDVSPVNNVRNQFISPSPYSDMKNLQLPFANVQFGNIKDTSSNLSTSRYIDPNLQPKIIVGNLNSTSEEKAKKSSSDESRIEVKNQDTKIVSLKDIKPRVKRTSNSRSKFKSQNPSLPEASESKDIALFQKLKISLKDQSLKSKDLQTITSMTASPINLSESSISLQDEELIKKFKNRRAFRALQENVKKAQNQQDKNGKKQAYLSDVEISFENTSNDDDNSSQYQNIPPQNVLRQIAQKGEERANSKNKLMKDLYGETDHLTESSQENSSPQRKDEQSPPIANEQETKVNSQQIDNIKSLFKLKINEQKQKIDEQNQSKYPTIRLNLEVEEKVKVINVNGKRVEINLTPSQQYQQNDQENKKMRVQKLLLNSQEIKKTKSQFNINPATVSHLVDEIADSVQQQKQYRQQQKKNSLIIHQQQYNLKKQKLDRKWNDIYGIQKIQEELVNNRIKIIKYNYSLDKTVQNFDNQEAFIELNSSGDQLRIFNIKITENINLPMENQHIEQIKNQLKEEQKTDLEQSKQKFKKGKRVNFKQDIDEFSEKNSMKPTQNLYSDSDEMHQSDEEVTNTKLGPDISFVVGRSGASCDIQDIQQITFGGFSSRFWVLRKHINCMGKEFHNTNSMPFFSWQCICIKLHDREFDISIKNERTQNNFVKYLLYKLNTIDGVKNSAQKLLAEMNEKDIKQYTESKNNNQSTKEFSKTLIIKIRLKNKLIIMRQTYLKYLIIKLRQKISFIAFKKKMTIIELFCDAITKSYNQLVFEGIIIVDEEDLIRQNQLYDQIWQGSEVRSLFINIMKLNVDRIKGTELYDEIQREISNPKKYMGANIMLNHLKANLHQQVIDHKQNFSKTTKMLNKVLDSRLGSNKCADIFKNAIVDSKKSKFRLYEKKSNKKYFKDRRIKNETDIRLSKLKLILGLKSLRGMLFIRALLQKIELSKQIFVMDVQEGQEVYICQDLSQQKLPLSFRYYDPLIQICQERMADERKDYYKLKNLLKKEIYSQVDTKTQFLDRCGIQQQKSMGNNNQEKLTFKYSAVNDKETREIGIYESIYTMGLQRSNYIQIDNELMHELQKYPHKVIAMTKVSNALKKKNTTSITEEDCELVTDQVYLKYCREEDVKLKRLLFLKYKGQFQIKLAQLKNKGQMLTSKHKALCWIDDNIDLLFQMYKKTKNEINLSLHKYSQKQIQAKNQIEAKMQSIVIPRSVMNTDGQFVKTAPVQEQEKMEMIFKLDNKLAFITNDAIKQQFIQHINHKQLVADLTEKEKLREFLKQYAENTIVARRRRIHFKHYEEMIRMKSKNINYEEKSTFIENSIERDIGYFTKMNSMEQSQYMNIKEKVKKVEQLIKINKQKMAAKKMLMLEEKRLSEKNAKINKKSISIDARKKDLQKMIVSQNMKQQRLINQNRRQQFQQKMSKTMVNQLTKSHMFMMKQTAKLSQKNIDLNLKNKDPIFNEMLQKGE